MIVVIIFVAIVVEIVVNKVHEPKFIWFKGSCDKGVKIPAPGKAKSYATSKRQYSPQDKTSDDRAYNSN